MNCQMYKYNNYFLFFSLLSGALLDQGLYKRYIKKWLLVKYNNLDRSFVISTYITYEITTHISIKLNPLMIT